MGNYYITTNFICIRFSFTPSSHSLCFAMRKTPAHYFGATSGSFALENALHFAILNFLCARCCRSQHFDRVFRFEFSSTKTSVHFTSFSFTLFLLLRVYFVSLYRKFVAHSLTGLCPSEISLARDKRHYR